MIIQMMGIFYLWLVIILPVCARERDRVHCCFPFMALNSSLLSHVIIRFLLFLCSLIHIFLWSDVMMMMLIV